MHSLKQYRIAKQLIKDAPNMIKVLDLTERALVNYKHYLPIRSVLVNVKEERTILEAHVSTAKKIIENKGRML